MEFAIFNWKYPFYFIVFINISIQALNVKTAKDAMRMLSGSERIYVDLIASTDARELAWDQKVIVRHWEPKLKHDLEFRGFFNHGKFCALTQYNHFTYFKSM